MVLLVTKGSRILIDGKSLCSHKTTKSMFSIASVLKWFESWWLVCTMGTFKTGLQDSLNLLVISSIFLKKKKEKKRCQRSYLLQDFSIFPFGTITQGKTSSRTCGVCGARRGRMAVESQLPRSWSGHVPCGARRVRHGFRCLYLRYQRGRKLQISYLPKAGAVLISPDVTGESIASTFFWWWS